MYIILLVRSQSKVKLTKIIQRCGLCYLFIVNQRWYWQKIENEHIMLRVLSESKVILTKILENFHIILLIHSQSKVILTKIIANVHIMLRVLSQSKVILPKIIQIVYIILLVHNQSKVILTKIMENVSLYYLLSHGKIIGQYDKQCIHVLLVPSQ